MYREYGRWFSPSLGRDMEFLWFGKFGRPVMLFPTSGGRFFENEDFKLTDSLADKVDRGEIQLVCVDSVDFESWYNRERRHSRLAYRSPAQYERDHERSDCASGTDQEIFIEGRARAA